MRAAIYLDHFATTPLDERVLDAMLPYFRDHFGNPSSDGHHIGQRAKQAVEKAREDIRCAVGCQSERGVLFTSGATESNNLLIRGLSESLGIHRRHIVVGAIEHKSVLEPICVAHAEPERYLTAQLLGGGQEYGFRSGTLNVPGIVGLAKAIEVTNLEAESEPKRIRKLRDRLKGKLEANVEGVHINGDPDRSIPGALNVSIAGVRSTAILARIQYIAVSGAAACGGQSAKRHVLTAMGLDRERVQSALRFCVGRFNTVGEIDSVVERIATEVAWIRNQPVFGEAQAS